MMSMPFIDMHLAYSLHQVFLPAGVDFNVLNSKFSFDLLPGKRAARRASSQPKVGVCVPPSAHKRKLLVPPKSAAARPGYLL